MRIPQALHIGQNIKMKITKSQLKQIIKEEIRLVREGMDYDDPEYGAAAETRHQAIQGAEQFIEKHPSLSRASGLIKTLYKMGFSIVEPHPAALQSAAAERAAGDAGQEEEPRDPYADESPYDAGY
jgi:hypothetical protein